MEFTKNVPFMAQAFGSKDLEARGHMQMASLMAGIGFGNTVTGIDHSLGHSFGKIFSVHHGLSVGMFLIYSICERFYMLITTDSCNSIFPINLIHLHCSPTPFCISIFVSNMLV